MPRQRGYARLSPSFGQLRESGGAEIRLHRAVLYNSIYQADDQLLVSQHAYGISERARTCPLLAVS